MNSKPQKSETQWQPCSQGAIKSASASICSRNSIASRRQFLKSVSAAAVVVAGAGFTGWSLLGQKNELRALRNNPNYPGGIACSEVTKFLAEYIDKSLTDAELVASIDIHLTKCGHCCEIHDSMTQSA